MSMIRGLIEYIQACPLVAEAEYYQIYTDLTGEAPGDLAVSASSNSTIQHYMDGSAKMESNYVLFVKQYLAENQARLEHNEFLEGLTEWVQQQNRKRCYPAIGAGKRVLQISTANAMLYYTT